MAKLHTILESSLLRSLFTDLDINGWANEAADYLLQAAKKDDTIKENRMKIDTDDMLCQLKIDLRNIVADERPEDREAPEMVSYATHYLTTWFTYQVLKNRKKALGAFPHMVFEVPGICANHEYEIGIRKDDDDDN